MSRIPLHRRKVGFNEAMEMLKRQIKRKAVMDGLIADPSKRPPRFDWDWQYESEKGTVQADSRSDARGLIKQNLGIPQNERLPVNITITRRRSS